MLRRHRHPYPAVYAVVDFIKQIGWVFIWCFFCAHAQAQQTVFDEIFQKHSAVMLLISAKNGQIVDANKAASTFYGYSKSELMQKSIQDINTLTAQEVEMERKLAASESRNFFIFRHRLKDNNIKTVAVYSYPVNFSNKKLLYSIIFDISKQRNMQNELWHYQYRLEQMVAQQTRKIAKQNQQTIWYLSSGLVLLSFFIVLLFYNLYKRRLSERQLEKNQNKYQRLINGLRKHFLYTHDTEGIFTYVSPSISNILGYERQEFLTHFSTYLTDSPMNNEVAIHTHLTLKGLQQPPYLVEIFHKNGDIRTLEVIESAVFNAHNQVIAVEGIAQDITDKRIIEAQLETKQQDLAKAQEIAHFGNWRLEFKNKQLFWSDEVFHMFGMPIAENPSYDAFWQSIHPEDRQHIKAHFKAALKTQKPHDSEYRIIHQADQSIRWLHERCEYIQNANGETLSANGTIQDITDRKCTEIALRDERLRLDEIVWATNVGTWEWHIPSDKVKINARWSQLLGYEAEDEHFSHMANCLSYYHPEDQNRFHHLVERYFAHQLDHFEIEVRMSHKQGHWVWLLSRGKVVEWDANNKPLRMSGTHMDISERKHAEDVILQLSRQNQLILESTGDAICGINAQGYLTFVNPAATHLLGYPESELIDQSLTLIKPAKTQTERHTCAIFSTLDTGDSHRIDTEIFQRKDQSRFYVEYISTAIEEDGIITGAVIAFRDISERKKQEEEIKRLATTDHLSGLYNRAEFDKQLKQVYLDSQQQHKNMALFILDLDRFKPVNDLYGHPVGDALLQQIAKELCDACQNNEMVSRIGGDEFAIISNHVKEQTDGAKLAEQIIKRCEHKRLVEQHEIQIGISIGISLFPQHANSVDALIRKADKALYHAKSAGRNTYCFADFKTH